MFGFSLFPKTVTVAEAFEKLGADGHILLDVRTKGEVRDLGIKGAVHIPLDRLEAELERLGEHASIHVICRSGSRSGVAVQIMNGAGISQAANVTGGMIAWEREGLPTTRG